MPSAPAESGIDATQLAGLLSPSLGDEKARAAIRDAMRSLGIQATAKMSTELALDVLEQIARTPGIVGVTARFAKSRVHLMR
ncbi:MAG: hypothetical protein AB7S26_04675 [Sandaracinaceae bacterium]